MTQLTADDSCAKAGTYKYEVPDLGEGKYRVIFTNGFRRADPWRQPAGIEFSGKVSWDGSSSTVTAVNCNIQQPIPVESVTISGNGVSDGRLSLKVGSSAQLTATVKPDNATNKTVSWDPTQTTLWQKYPTVRLRPKGRNHHHYRNRRRYILFDRRYRSECSCSGLVGVGFG